MTERTYTDIASEYIRASLEADRAKDLVQGLRSELIARAADGVLPRGPRGTDSYRIEVAEGYVTITNNEGRKTLDTKVMLDLMQTMANTSASARALYEANIAMCYKQGAPFVTVRVGGLATPDDEDDWRAEVARNAAMYD